MSTLFNLTSEHKELLNKVSEGEIPEDMAKDTLDAMGKSVNEKFIRCCEVSRSLERDLIDIQEEIKRLKVLESQKKNEISRIKNLILIGLSISGLKKIDLGRFKISTRKGRESLKVVDESLIPDEFIETVVSFKPDKVAAKKAIDLGEEVKGFEVVTGETSLIIK